MEYKIDEKDHATLGKLKVRIFSLERDNHKTQALKESDMSERIRKMIEQAAGQEVENDN